MHTPPKTKIIGLLTGLACVLLSSCASVAQQPYSNVSFETFYHELSPYGDWVHNPQYGQVWIPNVDRSFRPYQTRGHWVMTEFGNTWVSDYAWGWAPFHYGRWHLDDYYGWMWVPGTEWGPAWVAWRSGGGYYGWAPLSPGLNVNVSVNIGQRIPRPYWTFVRHRYITSPRIYDYCVPRRQAVNVINHTTVINNTYVYNNQHHYYSGPQRRDIERVTHRSVPVRRVQNSRRPGATSVRGGSVAMYRPTVRRRQGRAGSGRAGRDVARGSSPTRSSYDRPARHSTSPAARSSRTPDRGIRSGRSSTGTTRSLYDNRSDESTRRGQSRTPATRQARPGATGRDTQARSRSSSSSRDERRSPRASSPRTRRGSNSGSGSFSRPTSPSSSPSVSQPSRSASSAGRSPSVSRSHETRSAPSSTRSRSSTSSSGSRSSAPAGRSRSGSSRSGGSRSRPQ